MTANKETTPDFDWASTWISDVNKEFFGEIRSLDSTTVKKAIVGFVVLAIGGGTILLQVLT